MSKSIANEKHSSKRAKRKGARAPEAPAAFDFEELRAQARDALHQAFEEAIASGVDVMAEARAAGVEVEPAPAAAAQPAGEPAGVIWARIEGADRHTVLAALDAADLTASLAPAPDVSPIPRGDGPAAGEPLRMAPDHGEPARLFEPYLGRPPTMIESIALGMLGACVVNPGNVASCALQDAEATLQIASAAATALEDSAATPETLAHLLWLGECRAKEARRLLRYLEGVARQAPKGEARADG